MWKFLPRSNILLKPQCSFRVPKSHESFCLVLTSRSGSSSDFESNRKYHYVSGRTSGTTTDIANAMEDLPLGWRHETDVSWGGTMRLISNSGRHLQRWRFWRIHCVIGGPRSSTADIVNTSLFKNQTQTWPWAQHYFYCIPLHGKTTKSLEIFYNAYRVSTLDNLFHTRIPQQWMREPDSKWLIFLQHLHRGNEALHGVHWNP